MMNIGVGTLLTKGLGASACNFLIFGALRLYIEPFDDGLPEIPDSGGGGSSTVPPRYIRRDEEDEEDKIDKYKLTFKVIFRQREIEKSFIVDSFKKDKIIYRVNQINILALKFKMLLKQVKFETVFSKMKNNRFIVKWKK